MKCGTILTALLMAGAAHGEYVAASGGVETQDANYKYHTFTSGGTLTVGTAGTVDVLVVGGGGGGSRGKSQSRYGGGGGGGQVVVSNGVAVGTGAITVMVGAGGNSVSTSGADGYPGSNSSFGTPVPVLAANGVGGNGASNANGGISGSGKSGGTGATGGGGGGGDAAAGANSPSGYNGGAGGKGTVVAGFGAGSSYYGSGGGGGGGTPGGAWPSGGGGAEGTGTNGTANTGGGGGGGGAVGGGGGSGIVIVRYRLPPTNTTLANAGFEDGLNGWSAVGIGTHFRVGSDGGYTEGASALYFNGDNLVGDMVLEQSVVTIPGALYTLTFDYWAFGPNAQQLKVQVLDGPSVAEIASATVSQTGGSYTPPTYLRDRTLAFTAASSGATIRLSDTTSVAGSLYTDGGLDNVRLSGATVATPTIAPNGGTFSETSDPITLSCATEGATIYYTTNGDTPTTSSTPYTGTFTLGVTSGSRVRAIATRSGLTTSGQLTSAEFIVTGTSQVVIPTISPNGGTSNDIIVVTLACATEGATLYYTTNGDTPTAGSTVYSAPFGVGTSATVKAIGIKSGMADSLVASASFTVAIATPTITPNGGETVGGVPITLACATAGSTLRYTTDGGTPNASSTVYGGPFTLNASATVKVIAIKSGMSDSAEVSAAFTVLPVGSVVNGSFEYGTNGWAVTAGGTDPINYMVRTDEGATDGTHALAFNGLVNLQQGNAVFAQTLTTIPSREYVLCFDYGAYGELNRQQVLLTEVLDGGTVLTNQTVKATAIGFNPLQTTFATYTNTFKATSSSTTIRFTDQTTQPNSNSVDGILDHVRISIIPPHGTVVMIR